MVTAAVALASCLQSGSGLSVMWHCRFLQDLASCGQACDSGSRGYFVRQTCHGRGGGGFHLKYLFTKYFAQFPLPFSDLMEAMPVAAP